MPMGKIWKKMNLEGRITKEIVAISHLIVKKPQIQTKVPKILGDVTGSCNYNEVTSIRVKRLQLNPIKANKQVPQLTRPGGPKSNRLID